MSTVAEMLTELSDHGFTDTSTARKLAALQDTIWDIESREPWEWLGQTIDLTFSGSSGTASNQPTDFRAALNLHDVTNGLRLKRLRLDEFQNMMGASADYTTPGNPQFYYVEAGLPVVYPIPPSSTVVRMKYVRVSVAISDTGPQSLAAAILLPPRHHRTVVLGALTQLYDMEDDPELAVRFEQRYEQRIASMKADLQKQQYDRAETILVTDPDYDF